MTTKTIQLKIEWGSHNLPVSVFAVVDVGFDIVRDELFGSTCPAYQTCFNKLDNFPCIYFAGKEQVHAFAD